jgi:type I restriction enzyme S subunit
LNDVAFIDEQTHETFNSTEIVPGDVFLNITGASIGRSAIADDRVIGGNVNQHVCILRPIPKQLDSKYLNYFLLSTKGKSQIDSFQAGGNRQGLNFNQVGSFKLPVPPVPEQRAIATALSDVDALISSLDRLIAKKRDIKQAAMQQLLTGKTRLPGFSGQWQEKKLCEAGVCLRGVSYRGDEDLSTSDKQSTKRLLRSNNVQSSRVIKRDMQFVDARRVSEMQILRDLDILICMANGSKGLVGKAGLFRQSDQFDYTFGAFMGCFRTDSNHALPEYVFNLLQSDIYKKYINILLAGSSINNLTPTSIQSMVFAMPELEEQSVIAVVLYDMDSEIAAIEQRRNKTKLIKQGMMQELLTGRIRLV